MANNKLSFSQINQYSTCPQKYKYHYIDKLREKTTSAALLWGTAIDETLNTLLDDLKNKNLDYLGQTYKSIFIGKWREGFIHKQKTVLINNELIVYAASDFDPDIITEADYLHLAATTQSSGEYYDLVAELKIQPAIDKESVLNIYKKIKALKEAKGWWRLTPSQRKFFNHVNWFSMCQKGLYIIDAYIKKVVPNIKEVLATQHKIELENADGDSVIGYIDAIIRWVDGRVLIVDHKTSSKEYEWDSVLRSVQLTMYVHAASSQFENTKTAAYIVLQKQLKKNKVKRCKVCNTDGTGSKAKSCTVIVDGKRCSGEWVENIKPEAVIDVIINDIPERTEEIVIENLENINHLIKQGIFTRNLNACKSPFPCPYFKLCWENNKEDLVELKDKEEI